MKWINFGEDKTPSGTGRIIPLNRRALETLKLWAQQFPNRESEHCVFPAERYGASGDVFETGKGLNLYDEFWGEKYGGDPNDPVLPTRRGG